MQQVEESFRTRESDRVAVSHWESISSANYLFERTCSITQKGICIAGSSWNGWYLSTTSFRWHLGHFPFCKPSSSSMVSKASGVSILATFRKSHRIFRRRSSTFPPKHCLPIRAVKCSPNRDEFAKGSLVDSVRLFQSWYNWSKSNSELEPRKPDWEDTTFIGSTLQALSRAKRR